MRNISSVLVYLVPYLHPMKIIMYAYWETLIQHLVIIIIIIKKGRQCKAEREWYTPYQSEDPSPTIPTYRQKEEKGKKVEDNSRDRAAKANKEALALLLKPASPTPANTGLARSLQRKTEKRINDLL